jgi:hypothetical protein
MEGRYAMPERDGEVENNGAFLAGKHAPHRTQSSGIIHFFRHLLKYLQLGQAMCLLRYPELKLHRFCSARLGIR